MINNSSYIDYFKDLRRLGQTQDGHLVDYLEYQIHQQSNLNLNNNLAMSYKNINRILKKEILNSLKKTFLDELNINNINFSVDNNLDFIAWEKIIKITPLILKMAKVFNFRESINIHIKNNSIDFLGNIHCILNKLSVKVELTRIIRELLLENTIVTHKYIEIDENYKSVISFDYSDQDNLKYIIELNYYNETIKLAFPNFFENYHCGPNKINYLDDHLCFELTDKIDILKHKNIPRYLSMSNYNCKTLKTVLHFPFIFRPISLIIPRRGIVSYLQDDSEKIVSSCGKVKKNGQLFSLDYHQTPIYLMDIFSIFD